MTAQHTPPTPVGQTRRREWRRAAQLMQQAPKKYGLDLAALQPTMSSTSSNPTNLPNPSEFLSRAPGEGHARRGPQSINVREEDGSPNTDWSIRLTFLSHKPGTRWTGPRGQPSTQDPWARR